MNIITKIHGKAYDLTNFDHPGSLMPLYLIDKRDGTALFESYHPVSDRSMINKILSGYEIKDDNSINEQQVYDFNNFKENPFVKELREKVYNYFKNLADKNNCSIIESTKMSPYKYLENLFLLLLLVLSIYKLSYGNLEYIIFTPFFYWLYFVNVWHDAGHFALLKNKYFELLIYSLRSPISSCLGWYNRHTYLHHSYTNVLDIDKDILGLLNKSYKKIPDKIIKSISSKIFKKKVIKKSENKNKLCNENNKVIFDKTINSKVVKYLLYIKLILYFKITFYNFYIIYNYNFINVFFITIVPILLFFILFALFSQINHIHEENFTNNKNLYIHQIITSHNVLSQSQIVRILSGGLNCQIEHHLFPSVNSCHLPELAKIIKPLCKKYSIKYNESKSIFQAVSDTLKTIKKISPSSVSKYNFKKIN
jgi:fatty acid desaturase